MILFEALGEFFFELLLELLFWSGGERGEEEKSGTS